MPRDENWKNNISKALKGRTLSDDWKSKLSEAHKGKEPWNKGKSKYTKDEKRKKDLLRSNNYAKTHRKQIADQVRERRYRKKLLLVVLGLQRAYPILESKRKGKTLTEEHKQKISTSHKGITLSKDTIEKINNTKTKNKTWKFSKDELYIENKLKSLNINFKKQYKSEDYPFLCDFYLLDSNLYIEYQGNWTHGKLPSKILGPYDPNNKEHNEVLNNWKEKAISNKYYADAVKTWTIRDPLKRKTAKLNNLNWLEFFTLTDFEEWLNNYEIR